jgi:arylsulfatase A-like enzyme
LALSLVGGLGCLAARSAPRPNIVLILADDLGWGDLRCYNPDSKIPTPNLDRLAAEGMRFTDAHSPSSVCTPTRYALMTGRYAWRTRLKSGVLWGYSPPLIEPGRLTLPALLKQQGYPTACIGKWHLGLGWPTREPVNFGDQTQPAGDIGLIDYSRPFTAGPLTVGFDYFFGIPASLDMDPYLFLENDLAVEPPTDRIAGGRHQRQGGNGYWRGGPAPPGFTPQIVLPTLAEKAEAFVRRQSARRPFFLYFPLTAPHDPWVPTAGFRGRSGAGDYGDFVAQVDETIGRLLGVLEERKLAKNTLLIVTSDNGAHWPPGDIEKWGHRANGPWRGQKADVWEGGHRVPFLVRWPGKVKAGTTSDALVGLNDVFATAAELLKVHLPADAGEDSESLLPVLLGRRKTVRDTLVHHSSRGAFVIRQGDWKLCLGLGSQGFTEPAQPKPEPDGPRGQLHDLRTDPREQRNLWLERPDMVARLTALLGEHRTAGHSAPRLKTRP